MRINPQLKIRTVSGENIVIRQSADMADMTTVVGLNDSAMWLCNTLKGRDFEIEDAVRCLTTEYDVDESTARHDVKEWVTQMRQQGMLID